MSFRALGKIALFITIGFILVNCSRARFGIDGSAQALSDGTNLASGDELPPSTVDIICDPLLGKSVIYQTGKKHHDHDDDHDKDNKENDRDDDDNDKDKDDNLGPVDAVICEVPEDLDDPEKGLIGEIYYLLPQDHAHLFGGSLRNTVLANYFDHGYRVPTDIYMTQINVTPRSWETGFRLPDGTIVKDLYGDDLFEWFAIRLDGHLRLPAGQYDFAIWSDDGMTVSLNDALVVGHDGLHPPTFTCSAGPVTFAADESKDIHLEYFQGPRYEIAMQLLVRPHDPNGDCKHDGSWQEIPAANYSK